MSLQEMALAIRALADGGVPLTLIDLLDAIEQVDRDVVDRDVVDRAVANAQNRVKRERTPAVETAEATSMTTQLDQKTKEAFQEWSVTGEARSGVVHYESFRAGYEAALGRKPSLSREEFLAKSDAQTPDPMPIREHARRMLDSAWDFSGLQDPPSKIKAFVQNEHLWPLSEVELTIGQRRMWRAIRAKFRAWLRNQEKSQ